ncbi:HNH endonuclease signature motif containing protein [Methylobacterium sp. R2-1]|uniref:HNH endonuclease signature motif containing protein n=1 Tax=Methylobacterium sp. R2-1 TaxID=2587064 RepID=UPI0016149EAA|nr:HNH endonuclease signature motif containing protein [Methylobacterium sp. R2-1]MBB2964736.1 5-methylcytosine-specific restriction endonuclease McrA [Methylobacterium sp. R2-1]
MPTILGRRATPAARVVRAPEPERPKTAGRGYDNLWRKTSERHRRRHPFCVFCAQEGRQRLADAVDHKIPIEDGGDRLKVANLQSLCWGCHNGLKAAMQVYAREHGQIYLLPLWCDDPSERPARFSAGSLRR